MTVVATTKEQVMEAIKLLPEGSISRIDALLMMSAVLTATGLPEREQGSIAGRLAAVSGMLCATVDF